MAGNMDVDMDIDLGLDEVDEEAMNLEAEPVMPQAGPEPPAIDVIDTDETAPIAGEKVHVRGLDNLTTDNIKTFISENSELAFERIEWIDDTSANIVYTSAQVAQSALSDFIDSAAPLEEGEDLSELRKAKALTSHPTTELSVRIAFPTDVKKPRAHESSRFYLMNPEYDPREKRRRPNDRGTRDRRYNKRARDDEDDVPFDQTMYDDDPESLAARINRPRERRVSRSSMDSDDGRSKRARYAKDRGEDLFDGRFKKSSVDERLRNRSASPVKDGDGRFGFDGEDTTRSRRTRRRSFTPPAVRDRNTSNGNAGKELLGSTSGRGGLLQASTPAANGRELFPNALTPPGKELFPRKSSMSNHRRKDAFDAADETSSKAEQSPELKSRSLADRITGGPRAKSTADKSVSQTDGFNIRGTAKAQEGFSIRGTAQALGLDNPKVKELFPDKSESGGGRELFERIGNRGGQRRRAQDMFY